MARRPACDPRSTRHLSGGLRLESWTGLILRRSQAPAGMGMNHAPLCLRGAWAMAIFERGQACNLAC